ncbi:5-oxoprolinase subunit B family protein [Cumulibacter manganitolerans]|uniref:5-oxoprolinase subunit B family protein n=1 Tax=Cumulibacter manganitolerans TaxID=1884992 RepID=UPI0012953DFF|nr:allophanate hydrolase subunit 1 [Cumulibacter manganitolerans]
MTPTVLPYGERAVLLEVGSIDEVLGLYAALRAAPPSGVEDIVPAAVTVLVSFVDRQALGDALPALRRIEAAAPEQAGREVARIPVTYDGADLQDVATLTGLPVEEVVAIHSGTEYTVAFNGFSPGFAYLIGLDDRLRVPRRKTPRTSVPAGSVAMTGGFTAVYPRRSPGGWQLLGRTDTDVWDGARAEPALLRPGMRVRFEAR